MSKPIINGIDVSECGFYYWKHNGNELIENYCAVFNNKCIYNPDCYFKQFKRLQKENEELKEKINIYENSIIANHDRAVGKRLMEVLQALEEIREITEVNSLNTCWTILNNCNDCHNNNECGEQSPIAKLKFIKDKINEVLKCQ